jgi:hypothetical protein
MPEAWNLALSGRLYESVYEVRYRQAELAFSFAGSRRARREPTPFFPLPPSFRPQLEETTTTAHFRKPGFTEVCKAANLIVIHRRISKRFSRQIFKLPLEASAYLRRHSPATSTLINRN